MDNDKLTILRKKAEGILQQKGAVTTTDFINDIEKLVEELNIYHIELEMQNLELMQANKNLAIEQLRFKELYMDAPVAYFTLNHTGNIIELNNAAARLLQLPLQKFKYTSIFPYLADFSKPKFVQSFKQFFNSNEIEYGEITFLNPNGEFIYTKLNALCYFDSELNEKFCRCTVEDITEIVQFKQELKLKKQLDQSQEELLKANETLKETIAELSVAKAKAEQNEQQNQMLFDVLPIGLALAKMNGNLVYVNKAFTDIIGYTNDEILKLSFWNITPEKYISQVHNKLECLSKTGFYGPYEKEYVHKNGKLVPVRLIGKTVKIGNENFIWSSIENITERKEFEKKLKESEKKYRLLSENTSDGVSLYEDGKIVYVSDGFLSMLGYDRTEVENISLEQTFSFVHPNDVEKMKESIENDLLQKKKNLKYSYRSRNKNGEYIWLEDNINNEFDDEGNHIRSVVHSRDVSERKQIELIINQLNKRLETSLHAGNLAWWELYLPSGNVIFNENKALMLGYEAAKFTHYSDFMDIVHPEDVDPTMKAMHEHILGIKPTYDCEYRIKNSAGEYHWFYDIGKIVENQNGNIILNGIVQDITERKKADIQKNYLSAIIENTDNICVIKNLDLRVIASNMSLAKAAGKVSVNELLGKTDAEIFNISPEDEPIKGYMTDERIVQTMKKGEKILREEIVIYPDKSIQTVLTTKFPIYDSANKLIATANISTDISEKKQAEKIIEQQNQELIKLNADKDRFLQILAHDLKNPFNSILGFSELLLKNFRKYDETKIENQLNMIYSTSRKTYNLLEELLLWSKSQSGRLPFEPLYFNIRDILTDIVNLLRNTAESKNISIQYSDTQNDTIFADLNMVKTILRNLISNAIKFTHTKGQIKIYTENDGINLIITVSDNGVGIATNNIHKLWKISEQYTTDGTNGEHGTGLGLLLCKDFVEKHGGTIWVESEVGKGTEFKFTIPLILQA